MTSRVVLVRLGEVTSPVMFMAEMLCTRLEQVALEGLAWGAGELGQGEQLLSQPLLHLPLNLVQFHHSPHHLNLYHLSLHHLNPYHLLAHHPVSLPLLSQLLFKTHSSPLLHTYSPSHSKVLSQLMFPFIPMVNPLNPSRVLLPSLRVKTTLLVNNLNLILVLPPSPSPRVKRVKFVFLLTLRSYPLYRKYIVHTSRL